MILRSSGLCLLTLLWSPSVVAGGASPKKFVPGIAREVPAVGERFDLTLLMAGKASDRWDRARTLKDGLPPIEELDPLHHGQQLISWLAVVAMIEGALEKKADAPETWWLELLDLYRKLAAAEGSFRMFRGAVRLLAIQHGKGVKPLSDLADQLAGLPAYCRDGVRWLAGRRLKAGPGDEIRKTLLGALVEVHRRSGDWQAMYRAAASLGDLAPSAEAAAWEAEALFEMDRPADGRRALARARKPVPAGAVELARLRGRLARARRALSAKDTPAAHGRVADLLRRLGEPWRIQASYDAERVVGLANPLLDEVYVDALLVDGFDYRAAWKFAVQARGEPATAGFVGRRIGAGLAVLLDGLFPGEGEPRLDAGVKAAVVRDLEVFVESDPRLTGLTGLYLQFLEALAGRSIDELAGEMSPGVSAFVKAHPDDLAGAQLAFLIGQIDPRADDPWTVVKRFHAASGRREPPAGFLPLYASAAVREAVKRRSPKPLGEVLGWLEGRKGMAADPAALLFRAHLLAVRGLLAEGRAQAGQLQRAVDAYGQAIRGWGGAAADAQDPEVLCSAVASLATLLMQGRALDEARGLLDQVASVCGRDPDCVAVSAVIDLAAGRQAAQGEPAPDDLLARVAEHLSSRQAEIQARLWLALVAEAGGDEVRADELFAQAAATLAQERKRGAPVVLAPDLRSMVALSGQFNMGAGHSAASPFGLVISVTVSARMLLFPPAAVSDERMAEYLEKKNKKKNRPVRRTP